LQASSAKTVTVSSTHVVAKLSKGVFSDTPKLTDPSGALSKTDEVLINHIGNGFQNSG